MLIWAMFSLGYLMGVLITMKVVADRDDHGLDDRAITPSSVIKNVDPWKTFNRLTQINYQRQENKFKKFVAKFSFNFLPRITNRLPKPAAKPI